MSRPQLVSRADLLRLLARQPAAPLAEAARLAGYQPEQPAPLLEKEAVYETAPAAAEKQQGFVEPVFWHSTRRELLQLRPSLKPAEAEQTLPAKLQFLRPLRAQELQFPDLAALPELPQPAQHQSGQKELAQAVRNAARLRLMPRPALSQQGRRQRLDRLPPLVRALTLLRQSEPLERGQCDWLEQFFLRLARTWFERPKDAELLEYISHVLELLPDSLRRQQDGPAFLYGIVHRDELRAGAAIPPPYQAETIIGIVRQPLPAAEWLLFQEGEELFLLNSPDSGNGICLLHGSRIGTLQLQVDILLLQQGGRAKTAPVQTIAPICVLNRAEAICLQSQSERLFIQPCAKPAWAALIGRNSRDLFAEVRWLNRNCRLYWQLPAAGGQGCWQSYGGPVAMDSFGLTACISFQGKVMQRFRWLEPGQFFMGSPEDEPEREIWGKETRHEVRLSKGFWLADTPVTQELWQFVMQNNPSKFCGSDHPVDSVSWEDAQRFLQRLNALLPGLNARLPFEAEWEYGCRAGTDTAFSFGRRITTGQVNYNGQFPCSSGAKGLFRRSTVPARSLPANAWGLHEMHGNLWEWCQDWWLDDLGPEPAFDPGGPEQGEFRTVRGGSWFLGGKGVRSAVRGKFASDFRSDRVGFRIACSQEADSGKEEASAAKLENRQKNIGISLLKRLLRWRR